MEQNSFLPIFSERKFFETFKKTKINFIILVGSKKHEDECAEWIFFRIRKWIEF